MTISVTVSNIEQMSAADIARLAHMLLTHNGHASPMVATPLDGHTEQPSPTPLPVISFPEVAAAPGCPPLPPASNPSDARFNNIFKNVFAETGEMQSLTRSPQADHEAAKAEVSERKTLPQTAASLAMNLAVHQQSPGIEVDKAGLPWDGRIHASTRAKNADGTWRMRRGIEEALVQSVTGELRQTMAPVATVPTPPATSVPTPPFVPSAVPSVPQASITPETALVGAVPTVSHSDVPALTFPRLMNLITTAFTGKTLSQEQIKGAVEAVGLPSLPMLASRPDLVQSVADKLGLRA